MLDGPIRIEIGGTGTVRYRCPMCAELIATDPVLFDIPDEPDDDLSDHIPEKSDGA